MTKSTKEPLIRIVKRQSIKTWQICVLYLGAVLLALGIGAILLLFLKANPIEYYEMMFTLNTVGNKMAYIQYETYIQELVPLLITSLALSLAFKMRFWNIGGEGQFLLGALAGAAVAFMLPTSTNLFVTILLMVVAGSLVGGLIGLSTAALKVKFNTNETLFTLMINYIALYVMRFFGETKADWNIFLRPDSERPKFNQIPDNAKMFTIPIGKFSLELSFILVVLLVVVAYFYLKHTKQGYEIAVVGDSINTARYAGMKVNKVICRTMFMSAALIGAAGALRVSSVYALSDTITNDVGWTGIVVAWLAKLNPIGIVIVSALITILQCGSVVASSNFSNVDSHFADLLQGIILFVVLAADFFIRFKIVFRKKNTEKISKEANV